MTEQGRNDGTGPEGREIMNYRIHPGRVMAEAALPEPALPEAAGQALPGEAAPGYEFEEARLHLKECFAAVAAWARGLPEGASPGGFLVIKAVLHPDRLDYANSPRHFLQYLNLSVLGSHKFKVFPKRTFGPPGGPGLGPGESQIGAGTARRRTISLFVAGRKENLEAAAQKLLDMPPNSPAARQMACLETISPPDAAGHVKTFGDSEVDSFEAVLHLWPGGEGDFPLAEFCAYAEKAGFTAHRDHALKAGGLMFVPVRGARARLLHLARFVFIREIKEVGRLRGLTPPGGTGEAPGGGPPGGLTLPEPGFDEWTSASGVKAAILDAGLPSEHLIGPWLTKYVKSDIPDLEGGPEHGLSVASSFLFGPLPDQGQALRPLAPVSFYRVIDADTAREDGLAMYHTLANIRKALADMAGGDERPEIKGADRPFVNLSLGPDLPARDDTVHAWTAVLDELAASGRIFFTLAAGNNGARDRASGAARVEVPSDSVNAVGVGAADSRGPGWQRAYYSAVGPGRGPAPMKPDLLAFGGRPGEYFRTLAPGAHLAVANEMGTSFAAPYLLRSAVALGLMGRELSVLSIKCILIHYADRGGRGREEAGWGQAPVLDDLTAKPHGKAPLIFQGRLAQGKFLRAELPRPAEGLAAVKLKATFCYAPPVAPHDAAAYTRAALEICFVPDFNAVPGQDGRPPGRPFFDLDGEELGEDQDAEAVLWANVKSNTNEIPAADLAAPCFDIRYVDRSAAEAEAVAVGYSLVVTLGD